MEAINSAGSIYSAWSRNCIRCGKDFMSFNRRAQSCVICKNPPSVSIRGVYGKPLTAREWQIVQCVSEAKPNKEIAHQLHLHEGTVKVYVSDIFAKVGVKNRTELAIWWVRKGDNSSKTV